MGAGNSTSSKNVSTMMMKAAIQIDTDVSNTSKTGATAVNIMSLDCKGLDVKQDDAKREYNTENKNKKMRELYNSCFVAARENEKMCALESPGDDRWDITWKNGKKTKMKDFSKYTVVKKNAMMWCNESKENCHKCKSEGVRGEWLQQNPEKCVSHFSTDPFGNTVKCGWLADGLSAEALLVSEFSDMRGKNVQKMRNNLEDLQERQERVHCVPQCRAFQGKEQKCKKDPDCAWVAGECELAEETLKRFPAGDISDIKPKDIVMCAIKNVSQQNSIEVQAATVQDAAIQNTTKQDLQQNLKQVAIAMTKGISFGNSTSTANIGDMVANASTQISNKIKQECGAAGFALNVMQLSCSDMSAEMDSAGLQMCVIDGVEQSNDLTIANECTQKAVVSNKVIQDLQQTMHQTAVAKNTGVELTGFIIGYVIVAIAVVFAASKVSGPTMMKYVLPVVVAAGVAMHAVAFSRNGGRYGWKRSFYDYHSGPNQGNYTIATMNMKAGAPIGPKCFELDTEKVITEKVILAVSQQECDAANGVWVMVRDGIDGGNFKHHTTAGAPIGPKCFNLDTETVIETADTQEKCYAEDNGFWDSSGHEGIDIAIAACAKGKSSRDCTNTSLDYGQCEWRDPKDGEDAKCIVSSTDKGWGIAGRCFDKKDDIDAATADQECHTDGKCDAWFWQANANFEEMTAYKNRPQCVGNPDMKSKTACEDDGHIWKTDPNNIYLWKDGYEDPIIDVAGGFSPDCWGDKVCCDKKDCFKTGDPLSEACKGCCPSGYMATLIGKTGSGCVGALYNGTSDSNHCTSHNHADYDVKCSRCMGGKEAAKGTAYFYQQSPDQQTTQPFNVPNDTQEKRVFPIISCKAGITSWGGFVQDRNFDLVGISGCALWVFGLAVVGVIGLMHLLHATKNAIKELGKGASAAPAAPTASAAPVVSTVPAN